MNMRPAADAFTALDPPPPRPARRRRWRLAVAVAGLVLAAAAVRYLTPHTVAGEVVAPMDLAVEVKGPGTLDALSEAVVGGRVRARIVEMTVDRNDTVAAGEVLARLDAADLDAALAEAEAGVIAAGHAVSAAEAERDRAAATLAKAEAVHTRRAALVDRGVASAAELDDAVGARDEAEAGLASAGRAVERAEADADAARARVAAARTARDDTVLRAPIAGVVVARTPHLGEMLAPGDALMRIVDPASLVVTTRLDESVVAALAPGQPAQVTFGDGQNGPSYAGRVLRLGREVDTETREFELDVVLDAVPESWAIGQRGDVRIVVAERSSVIAVPKRLLARRDGEPGLWIAEDGRARWRPVALGAVGAERVEITSGLATGETVLAPDGLFPFMRVRLAEPGA